ncbi:MAG TPA: cytochrome c [Candidatus Acidoferrales bacterium]|nr:cytochrome c [Candidatus Acidoferrales bacterium]
MQANDRRAMLRGAGLVILIEVVALVIVLAVVMTGGFSMGADARAGAIEKWVGEGSSGLWISGNAPKVKNPVPVNDQTLIRGAEVYQGNCAVCHGGAHYEVSLLHKAVYPGVPQFLKGGGPDDPDQNVFYVIKHGIRFTGMPAWEYNMSDADIWTVVNFLKNMEHLPPAVQAKWNQMPMSPQLPNPQEPK